MFQYVRPKVLAALEWLKANNPLYRDIHVNTDWEQHASQDDTELWEAFTSQHSPREHSPQPSQVESESAAVNTPDMNCKVYQYCNYHSRYTW